MPETRIALLNNSIGAHHNWVTTNNPTPNYREPRLMGCLSINANRVIKGQSWCVTMYDDVMALHQNQKYSFHAGTDHIRIINLGPNKIHVKGFWIVYHGQVK